jgi:hypothetical protein
MSIQPFTQLVAAAIAGMLLAAALGKLNARARWALTTTTLFPNRLRFGRIARSAIPAAELAAALVILVRPAFGLFLAAALLLVFAIGILGLLGEQKGADCGCFGALMPSRVGPALAFRNSVLAGVSAAAAIAAMREALPPFRLVEILLLLLIGLHVIVIAELRRLPRQTLRGTGELMGTA